MAKGKLKVNLPCALGACATRGVTHPHSQPCPHFSAGVSFTQLPLHGHPPPGPTPRRCQDHRLPHPSGCKRPQRPAPSQPRRPRGWPRGNHKGIRADHGPRLSPLTHLTACFSHHQSSNYTHLGVPFFSHAPDYQKQ